MRALIAKLLCRLFGHRFTERTHYIRGSGALRIKRCRRCRHVDTADMTRARQFPFPKAAR